MDDALQEIISNEIHPTISSRNYDTYKKISCYNLSNISEEDFVVLGRGMDFCDFAKDEPSTIECQVLQTTNYDNGIICQSIFIRTKEGAAPKEGLHNYDLQRQKTRLENLLKAKEENLQMLKEQQKILTTDILNVLGGVLVAEIPTPSGLPHGLSQHWEDIISEAANKLKRKGIKAVSNYYEIDYAPSENETADLVREILNPVDKYLNTFHVPIGKWVKYWEAMKLTPDGGMIVGNTASKVRIYFMEKDLEDEIETIKKRLNSIQEQNETEKRVFLTN